MNEPHPAPVPGAPVLTIWHTYEQGTILGGTVKGDTASRTLGGGLGWKWSSRIITPDGDGGAWYIRMSRDKPAKHWQLNQTAEKLREAGYGVEIHIDNTPRGMTTVEADRAERMTDRADALTAKAHRQRGTADTLRKQADRCFPDNGQPLLVDHYSYPADKRRRERGWKKLGQSIELAEQADNTSQRADTAREHMAIREEPLAVARRIRTLETELRGWQRELAGRECWHTDAGRDVFEHRPPSPERAAQARDQIAHVENQLDHWRGIRAEQIATGLATDYSRDTITKGDNIRYRDCWYEVTRANPKSVTVKFMRGNTDHWITHTVPYDQIQNHRPAVEPPASVD